MRLNKSLAALLTLALLYSAAVVDSFRFLAVIPSVCRSHFIVGESLMKALAEKGHEVYVISMFEQEQPVKNYHHIPFVLNIEHTKSIFERSEEGFFESTFKFYRNAIETSENVLRDQKVQQLMASGIKFDAVICEVFLTDSLYGLSEHFKAPLIGLSTLSALTWDTDMVGSPSPPSYVPNFLIKSTDHMDFIQRAMNLLAIGFEKLILYCYYLPLQAAVYNKYFPNAARNMYTVRQNAAAVLLNGHVSLGFPRPYMSNHIEVGGMHIDRKRKPLPRSIRTFIEEAKHGVIYFSMGSNIRSKTLPANKMRVFLNAFSKIEQRVLWKFEDTELPGKPDNVFISEWFPQNDILAQRNVKVFITHGGLLSVIETIYHGTPVIGIPMFGDQIPNIQKAVEDGFAIQLDFQTFTAQDIIAAITTLLSNRTYTLRARQLSTRYKDQPVPPRDLAVYWVEHIARQKGATYLHCAGLDLNFFQYHNIDIIIFVLILICFFLYAVKRCLIYAYFHTH